MLGYIFGGDTGETPESVARKRQIAQALLAATGSPRDVGQGLSALGDGIAAAIIGHRADKAQAAGDTSANAGMNSLIADMGGGGAFPAAPAIPGASASPATTPAAPTDIPTQRVAQAFAASGGASDSGKSDWIAPTATVTPQAYFGPNVDISKLPAGMRNNNPGNIKFVGQNVPGIVGPSVNTDQGDPQAVFDSPLDGMKAAASLALRKNQGGKRTINELVAGQGGWTPGNTQAAANIAATMGVSPYVDVDLGNPAMMQRFLRGLVTQEHGPSAKLYTDDLIAKAVNGSPATGAVNSLAAGQPPAPALPPAQNVPNTPVAGQPAAPQPVQVAQAANTGTPGQMSDANALALLGASAVHPGQGASIADLLKTASNPWMSKNQSAVVSALLASKLKQQDPSTQLDMRYKQAQIDYLTQRAGGGTGVYGTPIYGKDPQTGKTVLGAIGKDGTFHKLDTGDVQVTPGVTWQDFGTYRQPFDKSGAPVSPGVAIDNAGKAADTAFGKGQGDARSTYASMSAKLPGLETVVTKLDDLAKKATYTTAGQILDLGRKEIGMEPRESAVARTEYMATVANQILPLLRDTFGAQFTAREGDTLMSTMGDPNKTPAEKQAVLKAFIEQKKRDISALAAQTGQTPPADASPNAPKIRRYNPQTGELE